MVSEPESYHYGDGGPSQQPTPFGVVNHDYSTSRRNNYVAKPPTFSADSTEFEWCKSEMYTQIIGIDEELWDIFEDGINIQFTGVGMVSVRKSHTRA